MAEIEAISCREWVKEFRKEQHWSQEKMATFLGIGKSKYHEYEKGKGELEETPIIRICTKFGISSDRLLMNVSSHHTQPNT